MRTCHKSLGRAGEGKRGEGSMLDPSTEVGSILGGIKVQTSYWGDDANAELLQMILGWWSLGHGTVSLSKLEGLPECR